MVCNRIDLRALACILFALLLTSSASQSDTLNLWDQCGSEQQWTDKKCPEGSQCTRLNQWYMQCRRPEVYQSTLQLNPWDPCGGQFQERCRAYGGSPCADQTWSTVSISGFWARLLQLQSLHTVLEDHPPTGSVAQGSVPYACASTIMQQQLWKTCTSTIMQQQL